MTDLPEDHLKEARRIYTQYNNFDNKIRSRKFTSSGMMQTAQLEVLLAIAGFLGQFPVCDHGNRGFCHYCPVRVTT